MGSATFRRDRLAAIAAAEVEHPWFVARRRMVAGLVERHRPPGTGVVVDVGCGTGATLEAVGRTGDDRIGIDLLASQAHAAGTGMVRADARRLPLAAGSAVVALACDVLEHVDEDRVVAAEVRRILVDGGVGVVTVPARPGLWSRRDDDAGHVRRYRRSTLRATLEGAGLDIVQLSGFAVTTLPGVAVSRTLARWWPGARDAEERVGGAAASVVGSLLRAEATAVVGGRELPTGSSLVAVVRRPWS